MSLSFKNYQIGFLLSALFLFSTCYLDDSSPNPGDPLPYSTIEGLFEQIGTDSQFFTKDASSEIIIDGNEGSRIRIPANALRDQNGAMVSGDVNIILKEIFNKRHMVLNNAPTTARGDLLESGGELFLSARQNGEELSTTRLIQARIPIGSEVSASDSMEVFFGGLSLDGELVWELSADSSQVTEENGALNMAFSRFNWINADYFYGMSLPTTTITAVPTGATITDGMGFIVFDDINSVMRVPLSSGAFEVSKVPVGMDAHIILLCMDANNLFVGIQEVKLSQDFSTEVAINFTTVSAIKQAILGLP